MNSSPDSQIPADLIHVVERLSSEKPELSALELDGVKQRARKQAVRRASAPRQKGLVVKTRIAVTSMLVLGILLSAMGGAGLAQDQSAALTVYNKAPVVSVPAGETPLAGAQLQVAPSQTLAPEQVVAGEVESDRVVPADPADDVQPAAQQAANDPTRLPFTGFAAIPVLLSGLALLGSGLVLRRRMPGEQL